MSSISFSKLPDPAVDSIFLHLSNRDAFSFSLVESHLNTIFKEVFALRYPEQDSLYSFFLNKLQVTGPQIEEARVILSKAGLNLKTGKATLAFLSQKSLSAKDSQSLKKYYLKFYASKVEAIKDLRLLLIHFRRFDILKLFIDQRETSDIPDNVFKQETASRPSGIYLQILRANSEEEIVQLIEKAGQKVLDRRVAGCTLLHRAVTFGYQAMLVALLKQGVCVNKKNMAGSTPLNQLMEMLARLEHQSDRAAEGRKIISTLVAYGADLDVINDSGDTPLCYAAMNGNLEAVKFLLSLGATSNFRNRSGQTPAQTAIMRGHIDVARFLIAYAGGALQKHEEKIGEVFQRSRATIA